MSEQALTKNQELALIKRNTVDIVAERVRAFQENGELHFPPNYSPENAMKSAWLILQNTEDTNKKKALEVCTKDSIANAVLSMVIQGLNPDKKQCYFIVYGDQLTMQRSYFGSVAVAKSVNSKLDDIIADIVYEGDEFEYEKRRGKTYVTSHKQKLENINKEKIVAAYATILFLDGTEENIIMTIDQVKQAWKQSKMNPVDDKGKLSGVHGKFTEEMAKKTVINKASKMIINTSNDSGLLINEYNRTEDMVVETTAKVEIAENANKIIIDVDTGEIMDDSPTLPGEAHHSTSDDTEGEALDETPSASANEVHTTEESGPEF